MTPAPGCDADSSPHHTPTAVNAQQQTDHTTGGICPYACSESCSTSCPHACVLLVPSAGELMAAMLAEVGS